MARDVRHAAPRPLPSEAASAAEQPDRLPVRLLGPAEVRELADELGVSPTKKLGQNFVIDPNTIRRIVRAGDVTADDVVVEVGPGLGSLTLGLLDVARRVVAVEIDPTLAAALPETLAQYAPGIAAGEVEFELVNLRRPAGHRAARAAADRPRGEPPLQRRGAGAAAHAGAVPEHRAHADHGAGRGRRPAGRRAGVAGLRGAVGEGRAGTRT